jgi:hypothetical protein
MEDDIKSSDSLKENNKELKFKFIVSVEREETIQYKFDMPKGDNELKINISLF